MIPLFLSDLMTPEGAIISFTVAVITAGGGAIAAWKKAETKYRGVRIKDPVPEVPVRHVSTPPSYHQHQALAERVTRVEVSVDQLRRDQQEQFGKLLQAGETRADRLAEKIDGVAVGFHRRVDQLLNHEPQK